jgi:hypothetical protein
MSFAFHDYTEKFRYNSSMAFEDFLRHLRQDDLSAPNVSHWQIFPARAGRFAPPAAGTSRAVAGCA